ncbi:MAG: helix-turn-helix domain-containing protein [Atopobiaceae bacterium]
MSWHESCSSKQAFPLPPADRTAFHLVCAYAREHLAEPLSVEKLCHVACVSESKLTRMFHATEGTTPIQWLRDQRLEEAARLLVRTDLSIGAIAHRVGFIRQGSLTSAFSRRYQMTPLAWRKHKSSR